VQSPTLPLPQLVLSCQPSSECQQTPSSTECRPTWKQMSSWSVHNASFERKLVTPTCMHDHSCCEQQRHWCLIVLALHDPPTCASSHSKCGVRHVRIAMSCKCCCVCIAITLVSTQGEATCLHAIWCRVQDIYWRLRVSGGCTRAWFPP